MKLASIIFDLPSQEEIDDLTDFFCPEDEIVPPPPEENPAIGVL